MSGKVDTVEIKITGNKKFRQDIVNKIYELLMDDDVMWEATKPGNGYTFTSSLEPEDD